MKLFSLVLMAFTLSQLAAAAPEIPPIKFLGYTYSFNTCATWVIDAGYKVVRHGGYIGNWYRADACFGSEPKEPVSSGTPLLESIRFVQIQSKVFLIKIEADSQYESLLSRVQKLEEATNILYTAAEDGLSKTQLKPFYSDIKFQYEMLTYDYYPVHVKYKNEQVSESWKALVKGLEKLAVDFEGS